MPRLPIGIIFDQKPRAEEKMLVEPWQGMGTAPSRAAISFSLGTQALYGSRGLLETERLSGSTKESEE